MATPREAGPIERVKYGWALYTRIARLSVEAKLLERDILHKQKLMGPKIFEAMSDGNHKLAEVILCRQINRGPCSFQTLLGNFH